jgi:hypothetical protein
MVEDVKFTTLESRVLFPHSTSLSSLNRHLYFLFTMGPRDVRKIAVDGKLDIWPICRVMLTFMRVVAMFAVSNVNYYFIGFSR